ncbi:MAG: energy transducer TonB [Saonia sp.]
MERKNLTSLICCFGLILSVCGQTDKPKCISDLDSIVKGQVYNKVDKMPMPEGGDIKLSRELIRNLEYCSDSTNTIGSRVYVGFVINVDGKVVGKRIYKNIQGTDLAEQALSLVDNIKWIPGSCNGKNVPVLYKLPITICLR